MTGVGVVRCGCFPVRLASERRSTVPALAVWSPEDGILGAVAPLALAAAAGTALVVDLDPGGPRYPGAATLAGLVADGPRRSDLEPDAKGGGGACQRRYRT
jgi:hypothetical protein